MATTFSSSANGSGSAPAAQRSGAQARRMDRQRATETSLDTTYTGDIIPPHTPVRSLILAFDGTGDQFDNDNSNIVQLVAMLKKGEKDQQLVYYQAGIGTYTIPQIATPVFSKISKTLDMMFANNLNHHVMGGYEFLMENYREGDNICIFGFSRGAYTARALAGMIHKVGLLPNGNHQQVPFAYRMYMKDDEEGWKQSVLFKNTFSIDVPIAFVGVFDTVASVGLIPRRLPFVKSNTAIKTFRHAISLDEHRAKFKANYYQWATDKELAREQEASLLQAGTGRPRGRPRHKQHAKHGSKVTDADVVEHTAERGNGSRSKEKHGHTVGEEEKERKLEKMYTDPSKPTDVLEVFFAGCHCDIGGGSVSNDTRHSLARIPLRWMIRQCFLANTGIQFEADKLREVAGIDPATLWPIVQPRPAALPVPVPPPIALLKSPKQLKQKSKAKDTKNNVSVNETNGDDTRGSMDKAPDSPGSGDAAEGNEDTDNIFLGEETEELHDALSPVYDQLKIAPHWWALELLPMRERVQRENGTWTRSIEMNLARPRVLPGQQKHGIKVHRSVKTRVETKELSYRPRLQFDVEPEWVD